MEQLVDETAQSRAHTDASLGAERAGSDMDDRARAESARRILDDLIERDRLLADIELSKFRDGADRNTSLQRVDASSTDPCVCGERVSADELTRVERSMADATLLQERRRSDVAVDAERHEQDILRVDLENLRRVTDDGLSCERKGADSTADELGNIKLALRRAQSGRGQGSKVLAMVSHDLRSPLNVISLNTERILETTLEPCTRTCALSSMRGVARMERLLSDLLDLARIESGTMSIVRRKHEIGALLLEVSRTYESMFASRNITFTVTMPTQSVEAFFDHDRIVQVLSNLLGNALKFTPSGGAVCLSTDRQPRHIAFTLHNNGPSISPSAMPHIFERFWQEDEDARRGLGLGLNICKTIVEGHGGRIWCESELDNGATFQFTLPIR